MKIPRLKTLSRAAGFLLLLLLALYLGAGWLLPHLVNKKALDQKFSEWLDATFAYTSPASIETVDLALRQNGRLDLYLQEVELDAPNPAFALPWLKIDTVRASAPIYELYYDLAAVIQLRSLTLRLQYDERHHWNIADLRLTSTPRFPLPEFTRGDFTFKLMDNRLLIEHPLLKISAALSGEIKLHPAESRIAWQDLTLNAQYTVDDGTRAQKFTLRSTHGWWHYQTPTAPLMYEITLSELPLRLFNLFAPELPLLPLDSTLDGTLFEHAGEMEFRGEVNGWTRTPIVLRCNREPTRTLYAAEIYAAEKDERRLAEFTWEANAAQRQGLHGKIAEVNLHNLLPTLASVPPSTLTAWGVWLNHFFPTANLQIEHLRWRDLRLNNVRLDVVPSSPTTCNLAAESRFAGGKITLVAKNWHWTNALPENLFLDLEVLALGDTLLPFAGWLPSLLQISPIRGSGRAMLRYQANATPPLTLHLDLANVVLPTLTASETISALLSLQEGLRVAENLVRQANANAEPLPPQLTEPPEHLTFTTLRATYEITPAGGQLSGLEIACPAIGNIRGYAQENADQTLSLTLLVKDAPTEIFRDLSPEVKTAAMTVMQRDGLKIEALAEKSGGTIERVYIQDIFREWVKQQ